MLLLILRNPNGIHIDGLELTPLAASTPTAAADSSDDFFSSWDKEKPKAAAPAAKAAAGPPSVGMAARAPATTGPRTVTSSSLRSGTGAGGISSRPAPTSRLSSTTTSTSGAASSGIGGGGKLSKLGAKKATTSINFEEAQRKALEEEERVKRLGYDKIREEEEAKKVKEREAEERRKAKAAGEAVSRTSTPVSASRAVDDAPKPARLGFGQVIGAAAVPVTKT